MNQADKANVFDKMMAIAERGYDIRIRHAIGSTFIKLCDDDNCIERAIHLTELRHSKLNLYLVELARMEAELSKHREEPTK